MLVRTLDLVGEYHCSLYVYFLFVLLSLLSLFCLSSLSVLLSSGSVTWGVSGHVTDPVPRDWGNIPTSVLLSFEGGDLG